MVMVAITASDIGAISRLNLPAVSETSHMTPSLDKFWL